MEESVRGTLAVLAWLASGVALAQEGPAKSIDEFDKRFPAVLKNAAAEDLETLGLALGFDTRGDSSEDHPTKEDREAFLQAGYGSWLDAQSNTSDDSITVPPERFLEFLQRKQSTVWRVVGLLEKEVPEWGFDSHREQQQFLPELLFVAHLNRLLLAACLVEERAGRHAQASDLVEACWSLYRSVAWRPELIFQLIATSAERSQAGVLRKLSEPSPDWVDRMVNREPLQRMLTSLRNDSLIARSKRGALTAESLDSIWTRLPRIAADQLEGRSACEISKLSSDEMWKPVIEEVRRSIRDEETAELQIVSEISTPNITNALHRVARLLVECELTARILELRLEKAAARPSRWSDKLYDTGSRVCPGADYEYRSAGGGMSIRFKGSVGDLEAPARPLPLSFEARAPKLSTTATPTRRASPTPTPSPSLTPLKAGA